MSFLSHLSQPLLQGTYGVVYKARDTRNHNIVAMKKVQLRGSDREVIKDQFDQVRHSTRVLTMTIIVLGGDQGPGRPGET